VRDSRDHWPKKVACCWSSRRETILASDPLRPHQQAGHMDASDPIRPEKLCGTGPSTYGPAFAGTTVKHQPAKISGRYSSAFIRAAPGVARRHVGYSASSRRWEDLPGARAFGADGFSTTTARGTSFNRNAPAEGPHCHHRVRGDEDSARSTNSVSKIFLSVT